MKIGIKIKFAAILSALLLAMTLVTGFILITIQRSSLEAQMRSMAGAITEGFAADSKIPLLQKDRLAMNLLVQGILRYRGISDAYILNENLVIEGHNDLHEVGAAYYKDKDAIVRNAGEPPWEIKGEDNASTFITPIVFNKTTVGYAVVAFSRDFIRERTHVAVERLLAIVVIAIGIVSAVSFPLAKRLLRPIMGLVEGTKEIAGGNLDYRLAVNRKDEIGELVKSFNGMAGELKKKEVLRSVFNRYVSPHVADEILKEPEMIRLGGARHQVTVFFADIRDFTALSSQLRPEDTVELLNGYFTLVTDVIMRFDGTVDKYIGDAVMGVFGAPVRSREHLENGIKASMAVKFAVEEMNRARSAKGLVPLSMGIGLGSGEVVAGNLGSHARMDYTIVGVAVNLASRLAGIAHGGDVVVNEEVYNAISQNVEAERLDNVSIKGMERTATVYRLKSLRNGWKAEVDGAVEDLLAKRGV